MILNLVKIVLFTGALVLGFGYAVNFNRDDDVVVKRLSFLLMLLFFSAAGTISIVWD